MKSVGATESQLQAKKEKEKEHCPKNFPSGQSEGCTNMEQRPTFFFTHIIYFAIWS